MSQTKTVLLAEHHATDLNTTTTDTEILEEFDHISAETSVETTTLQRPGPEAAEKETVGPSTPDDFLGEHWDCFGSPASFENDRKTKTETPLRAGEVYGLLDFCTLRAPSWYRTEVNRISELAGTTAATSETETNATGCPEYFLSAWESSNQAYLEQQTASPAPTIVKPAAAPPKAPTRIQPGRGAKRKALETNASPPVAKKSRIAKTQETVTTVGTYHISRTTFERALHFSLTSGSVTSSICYRSYRSFRSRLIARVTRKMMAIYSQKAADGKKARRCVLHGKETERPWCRTGRKRASVGADELEVNGVEGTHDVPVADMVATPSCANWPSPPKVNSRIAKEDAEGNVLEIEGLRFLVDVCGEPAVVRVMMV